MNLEKKATQRLIVLFFAIYTVVLMFFCSGSSPLIDAMTADSSVFFLMGRGMANGKIVYTELFDHKGWYLYLFNCLGALLSDSTTVGIIFIEICFVFFDAILFFSISQSLLNDKLKSYYVTLVMLLISLNYFTYQSGNLSEEYALTFQLISILLVLKYYKSEQIKHPPLYMLLHGICVGIVFELRANMVAMWGAIAIVIVVVLLIHHEIINAIINIFLGFAGILIGLLPPVLYGIITHSLRDMIEQSILFNLSYSGNQNILSKLIGSFGNLIGVAILIICILSSIIVFAFFKKAKWIKYLFLLALLFSVIGVSVSGKRYGHYYEYFVPFFIPLVIFLICRIRFFVKKSKTVIAVLTLIIFAASLCFNLRTPIRILAEPISWKESQRASELATINKQLNIENEKVLVTGNCAVVYNKMNVLPSIKYFYTPYIAYEKYPYAVDAQMDSIINQDNDIVVICYANHQDYTNGIIYKVSSQNENAYQILDKYYDLIYDQNDWQMWVKSGIHN